MDVLFLRFGMEEVFRMGFGFMVGFFGSSFQLLKV